MDRKLIWTEKASSDIEAIAPRSRIRIWYSAEGANESNEMRSSLSSLVSQPALSAAERGVFYENDRPTKNALEKKWIDNTREKLGNPSDLELLQKTFERMK